MVIDTESDEPEVIGVYMGIEEDTIMYRTPDGEIKMAPADCVTVQRLDD